jgi:hypothetical protein
MNELYLLMVQESVNKLLKKIYDDYGNKYNFDLDDIKKYYNQFSLKFELNKPVMKKKFKNKINNYKIIKKVKIPLNKLKNNEDVMKSIKNNIKKNIKNNIKKNIQKNIQKISNAKNDNITINDPNICQARVWANAYINIKHYRKYMNIPKKLDPTKFGKKCTRNIVHGNIYCLQHLDNNTHGNFFMMPPDNKLAEYISYNRHNILA